MAMRWSPLPVDLVIHTTAYSESQMQVYSWRWRDFGRLGHRNSSDLFTPQPIKALQGIKIKQIACGDSHCLALTMKGEVQRLVVGDTLWRTRLMKVFMAGDGISNYVDHHVSARNRLHFRILWRAWFTLHHSLDWMRDLAMEMLLRLA